MKKNIVIIAIISLIYLDSCKEPSLIDSKRTIKGNWYYLLEEDVNFSREDKLVTYNEVFINNNKVFHYTELVGYLKPEEYKVLNDSFYSRDYNDKMLYKGKIENISKNGFDLTYKSQAINYHRINDGVTFEDVILKVDSLDNYLKDYNMRLLKAKGSVN